MNRIDTLYKAVDLFGAGKHGFRDGDLVNAIIATRLDAEWFNAQQEEPLSVIEGAGLVPAAGNYTQLRQAMKRMFGGNVTTVNAANSPLVLTADNTGLVIMDATGGNISATLPAANALTVPLKFLFVRVDAAVNSVTINRAGADTFLGGATSQTMTGQGDFRGITSDIVSKWLVTAKAPLGHGQTRQNLTASRSSGVTYTNTTGREIEVTVIASGYQGVTLTVGGVVMGSGSSSNSTIGDFNWTVSSLVKDGETYVAAVANLVYWREVR